MASRDIEARAAGGDIGAQLDMAALAERAGRHREALEWLTRAADGGHAEAQRVLGMRLILGWNAPTAPAEGAARLAAAAESGSAQAAAICSVLAGGGLQQPQSWSVALDYLQRAAELGLAAAQEQLRLLNRLPAKAAAGDRLTLSWADLRGAIRIDEWIEAPPAETISEAPRIARAADVAPPEVCRWLIEFARPRLVRAKVFDAHAGQDAVSSKRTNAVANVGWLDSNFLSLLVQTRIGGLIGVPVQFMEAFAILHYGVGEEAVEHFDFVDPAAPNFAADVERVGLRTATALLYLNQDYYGGETAFPVLGLEHKGRTGEVLVFWSVDETGAPDRRTLHAGRPPASGEKWVLSQFVRDKRAAGT